jgi:hypothetical protein
LLNKIVLNVSGLLSVDSHPEVRDVSKNNEFRKVVKLQEAENQIIDYKSLRSAPQ